MSFTTLTPRPVTIDIRTDLIGHLAVYQLHWALNHPHLSGDIAVTVPPKLVEAVAVRRGCQQTARSPLIQLEHSRWLCHHAINPMIHICLAGTVPEQPKMTYAERLTMNQQNLCRTTLTGLMLSLAGVAHAEVIADAAADYVDQTTLAPGWTYLYSDAATGGTEVALTPGTTLGGGNGVGNAGFGGLDHFGLPGVLGSSTADGQQYEIFADGFDDNGAPGRLPGHAAVAGTDLVLHPSADAGAEFLILRYTLQPGDLAEGSDVTIEGSFRDNSGREDRKAPAGSIRAEVYVNGEPQFSVTGGTTPGALSQTEGTFNIAAGGLPVGSTIDFVVNAHGNSAGDESALRATISTFAEPG